MFKKQLLQLVPQAGKYIAAAVGQYRVCAYGQPNAAAALSGPCAQSAPAGSDFGLLSCRAQRLPISGRAVSFLLHLAGEAISAPPNL